MVVSYKVNFEGSLFVVNFVNKLVGKVKLKEIISNERSTSAFPGNRDINGFREPYISYKYSNTIRSEVVNYRQAIIEEERHPVTCNCSNYDNTFIDCQHNHVFTGNLNITRNIGLKNLLGKGLNFREPPPPNKTKSFQSIAPALDSYIHGKAT